MPAEALAYRPEPVDERKTQENTPPQRLLTPAMQDGLDALERELNAYLTARQS